jgi:hypothetical protein
VVNEAHSETAEVTANQSASEGGDACQNLCAIDHTHFLIFYEDRQERVCRRQSHGLRLFGAPACHASGMSNIQAVRSERIDMAVQTPPRTGFEKWQDGINKAAGDAKWNSWDCEIQRVVSEYNRHLSGTTGYIPLD